MPLTVRGLFLQAAMPTWRADPKTAESSSGIWFLENLRTPSMVRHLPACLPKLLPPPVLLLPSRPICPPYQTGKAEDQWWRG